MYIEYNSNPENKLVGDCVIRAISKVTDQDWERTYMEVCVQGFMMHDMPSSNSVWGGYLFTKGWWYRNMTIIKTDLIRGIKL